MTDIDSILPPPAYFEERDALALLVPRAKLLAALADALGTAPTGDTVTIPRVPTAALLRPFIACPEGELPEAWEAMVRVAAVMNLRASQPQGDQDADLGKTIDERDTAEGWADGLAVQIGKYFGRDIGEHSSGHCPWQEAKDILEEAAPYKPAAAVEPADEREAFETWAKAKSDWNPNLERKGDGYAGAFAQEAWNGWRGRGAAPASGSWIAAADVDRLVRELDVALHGEADAAPQASLCDIVCLVKKAARKLGRPVLAAPAAPAVDALSQAARDVLAERRRQVAAEGHAAENDDGHNASELAYAAAWYATPPCARHVLDVNDMGMWPITWPAGSFKPGDRRRELVKSSALAIAELERLDRAAASKEST